MRIKLYFVLALLLSSSLFGDALVSSKWLNSHLDDSNLRVIFISNSHEKRFIPKSALTSIGEWRKKVSKHLLLRYSSEIEPLIQKLGVDKNSHVVIYSDGKEPRSLLFSSYLYWALNVYGIKNVSILDGGLKSWIEQKFALDTKAYLYPKSQYRAEIDNSISIDFNGVKNSLGKVIMVDARPHQQYFGLQPSNGVKRLGHIKGAINYPWIYSVDSKFRVIDKKVLEDIFFNSLQLKKSQETIVYCTGGLETSFNFFVLHGVLGFDNIKLYDSSMKEWGNRDDAPMEKYFK